MLTARMAGIGLGAASLVMLALPAFASAQSASIETRVLIPQGSASCGTVFAQEVKPYIYDGHLDSFDVTLSDASYVAVLGSAGKQDISMRYMRRSVGQNGSLQMHVDIASERVGSSLPVSLTLLSAKQGSPVCISVLSFTVSGMGIVTLTPTPAAPASVAPTHKPPASPSTPVAPAAPEAPVTPDVQEPVAVKGGLQAALERVCTAAGSYQLWFILLALYMIGVGIVAFMEPPLARKGMWLPISLIVAPLVLLLAFWFFTPACRVAAWIPFVLMAAAALGLVSALREEPNVASIIQLPPPKK